MDRICIIGVGLIGGSIGLAVRSRRPDIEIVGVDQPDVMEEALSRGAISTAASSLEQAVVSAGVTIVCAPIGASLETIERLGPLVPEGAIVTDVCSIKGPLMEAAQRSFKDPNVFVGGHPMTGSEKSGVRHADEFLFENATYVLCPAEPMAIDAFEERYALLIDLIALTGSRVLVMDAERHDRIAARISHLPQLLAISLVNSVARRIDRDPELAQLSAGGFRDMTRIASSSFTMWENILSLNATEIDRALEDLLDEINALRNALSREDLAAIGDRFSTAETMRTSIPKRSKGFIQPLADLFVFVTDQPGALSELTGLLARSGVSIKDIELLKIREGTGGTFRIGLESDAAADRAGTVLEAAGYRVHRL